MRSPRKSLNAEMKITGMPEVLALLRKEFADIVREVAADEEPTVAGRLREIAAAFEAGQEP